MSSIKVAVRCRPLFANERAATGLDLQGRRILLDSKTYDPDFTFTPNASQDDVFDACKPILECVKDGLNGTIMVYGQTGTGKTYTMLGNDGEDNGIAHKVIAHMLSHVHAKTIDGCKCALTLSIVEIYNEHLSDMLSPNGDEEVTLIGGFPRFTNKVTLGHMQDANLALKQALAWRHTAKTLMNERSSRSHVVFILDLEEFNVFTEETDVAHLFLVDLAGSESIKKSQASGFVAGEAGRINKSLLALKSVFLALSNTNEATRPTHVPYRDSRLTELLQDSIGGTARTLMIACISSVGRDIEETKSTLSYAVKARSIRNAANTEREKLLIRLRSIEVENQRLRNRLQERVNEKGGYYVTKEEHEQTQQLEEEANQLRSSVDQLVKESQASDARKHISESQAKILQGMLYDKEEQLQSFKTLYHDALLRFENHSKALQRVVQATVAEAKCVMQSSAVASHQRLVEWRDQVLSMLASPLPMEVSDPTQPQQEHSLPPQGYPSPAKTRPSSDALCPVRDSQCISMAPRRSTASLPISPARRSRAARKASSIEQPPPIAPFSDPAPLPGGQACKEGAAWGLLEACDASCQRITARINQAFKDLLHELTEAHERSASLVQAAEERRRRQTEVVCQSLREGLEQGLVSLKKAQERAADEIKVAQQNVRDRLCARGRYPNAANPQPLQRVIRDACLATVRQGELVFPPAEAPAEVQQSLEHIERAYEGRLTSMRVAALVPLSSVALGGDMMAAFQASQETVRDSVAEDSIPSLVPTTAPSGEPTNYRVSVIGRNSSPVTKENFCRSSASANGASPLMSSMRPRGRAYTRPNAMTSSSAEETQQRGRCGSLRPSRFSVNMLSQYAANSNNGNNVKASAGPIACKRTRSSNATQSVGNDERRSPAARMDPKG
ncbi:unnamed protein product [Phytomonas sp. EM1]|nr:unnamed protein product [Phytomonas sp. EM1]|eukprot:CCW64338.1 unnamed protein product [Phytomonas sp. isolate EM1]